MKSYHHYMLVLKLLLSAFAFNTAVWLLGSAMRNQRRLNEMSNFMR